MFAYFEFAFSFPAQNGKEILNPEPSDLAIPKNSNQPKQRQAERENAVP